MIGSRWLAPLLSLGLSVTALADDAASALSAATRTDLSAWFDAVGAPRTNEAFGSYLVRAARLKQGIPYEEVVLPPGRETLHVELDRFECVSFIESSLALARCGWKNEPTASCFEREIIASRYRNGRMGDYASRLHYFVDWIYDNEGRGRVTNLTPGLGGEPTRKDFFFITSRAMAHAVVPGEELSRLTSEMSTVEKQLSGIPHLVLSRERAPQALDQLQDGDLVAFVRERAGMLVHHAGFVVRVSGKPRLLHASSFHHHVVLTPDDITSYLLRRPERRGVILVRPLPPDR